MARDVPAGITVVELPAGPNGVPGLFAVAGESSFYKSMRARGGDETVEAHFREVLASLGLKQEDDGLAATLDRHLA